MSIDYSNAYSEVVEVIKHLPKEDYEKIPKKLINLFEQNRNEENIFTYNVALPFNKQEISKDAKIILAILYRNCWITEEEKIDFLKREQDYQKEIENIKREKYNPDKIFEKREKKIVKELKENHYLMVNEKWYKIIINKIKKILFNK